MSDTPCFDHHLQQVAGTYVAVLALDMYELVNLRAALEAIGFPFVNEHSPLDVLNSGDWIGQIYLRLPKLEDILRFGMTHTRDIPHPNRTPEQYREAANAWGKR